MTGALLLIAAAVAMAVPGVAAAKLTISPAAGTPDANPATQISILGIKRQKIRSVSATGSVSGEHQGDLQSYSGDRGASFVPDDPFTQDEKVAVTIRVKGRDPVHFKFTVAHLGNTQPLLNLTKQQPAKLHHYVTQPGLVPPKVAINQTSPQAKDDGDIMITPLPSPIVHPESNNSITITPVGPGGPMIVDPRGRVVWFKQLTPPDVAANLRIQRYRGRKVLTWWQGGVTPSAFGLGEGVIADHSYRTIKTVHAGNGYPMDIHEFELSGPDALFTIYSPVMIHLPGTAPGTLSPMLDAIVQEVDVKTGLVVWEWHAYGHIPLADSYATPQNSSSYDAFHINSVQDIGAGHVLISARDTSAIYDINQASGKIEWTLGGKASSFHLGKGARFWFQHDAQMLSDGRVSMFDDEAGPPQKGPTSRGLVLNLSKDGKRATVDREYTRPDDTSAQSEGSLQLLPSGRMFAGFGAQPFFSEWTQGGTLLFDGSLPVDDGSYRVYRFPWSATPKTKPDIAVTGAAPSRTVYASWNGATDVRKWEVLAGPSSDSLRSIARVPKAGFETRIDVQSTDSMFALQALGARGHVLGTSSTVIASCKSAPTSC